MYYEEYFHGYQVKSLLFVAVHYSLCSVRTASSVETGIYTILPLLISPTALWKPARDTRRLNTPSGTNVNSLKELSGKFNSYN